MAATPRKAQPAAKPKDEDTVTVKVRPGVLVFHDGEQRGGTLHVPKDIAQTWAARGWAEITG
jgi:hypothetical protein